MSTDCIQAQSEFFFSSRQTKQFKQFSDKLLTLTELGITDDANSRLQNVAYGVSCGYPFQVLHHSFLCELLLFAAFRLSYPFFSLCSFSPS